MAKKKETKPEEKLSAKDLERLEILQKSHEKKGTTSFAWTGQPVTWQR